MSTPLARATLVGVATGSPDGGVAIIRLSGPEARAVAQRALRGAWPEARRASVRRLGAPVAEAGREMPGEAGDGGGVEQAVVLWMPGPASFTGEDVVELHVHAGARNVEQVVGWLMDAGAQAAQAGDFTRRAFEHGRLTLDQAEGIAAVIGAQTQAELEHGRRLVGGELTRQVEEVRAGLSRLRALVEATLGFPDDLEDGEVAQWATACEALRSEVESWLSRFDLGVRARSRLRVTLAGPPNAGKSSLFNALVGRARALVSDTPGTTRDYVEVECEWDGRALTLVDTAGMREAAEAVEAAGVELSVSQVRDADLVLWVEEAGADAVAWPPAVRARADALLPVRTKLDLWSAHGGQDAALEGGAMGVSTVSGDGVDALRAAIVSRLWGRADRGWIGLQRHRQRCEEAVTSLRDAQAELERGVEALELAALPLQEAQARLDAVVGRTVTGPVGEGVLADIFGTFCIGK